MRKIVAGVKFFHDSVFPQEKELFIQLASGQKPRALMITCADSRVQPNLITQTQPGELFLIRNAGNLVPPWGSEAGGEVATIEYALSVLKIRNVILCGHTDCGAMKAFFEPEKLRQLPAVSSWLRHTEAARKTVQDHFSDLPERERLRVLIEENVLAQLENLKTHPSVASGLAAGELEIYGWIYELETGSIYSYDYRIDEFVLLDAEPDEPIPSATPPPRRRLRQRAAPAARTEF